MKFESIEITFQIRRPMLIDAGIEKGKGYLDWYLFFGPITIEVFFWR